MSKTKKIHNRKTWFRGLKCFLKLFVPKPKFVYLGESITKPSIILSNHVGASAPVKYELYFKENFRFWGTYEMNSGLKSVYKYLSTVYFHQKKHKGKFVSKLIAFFACPFANLFYKGLNLISTYKDHRFKNTIKESIKTIQNGQNLIIFPEDSSKGYFDNLTQFFAGFVVLAKMFYKKGIDLPIFVSYYRKKDKTFVIDKPINFSDLVKTRLNKYEIAKMLCNRANALATIDINNIILLKRT